MPQSRLNRTSPFIAVVIASLVAQQAAAQPVNHFEKKVRPLLADKCWSCHGPNEQKNGLRLDSRSAILKGGKSGPAVVPGKPEASLLLSAVRHSDKLQMPPKKKLVDAEIAALAEWIRDGAVWPDPVPARAFTAEEKAYWAFQPVKTTKLPAVKDEKWARTPIDRFILAKLEEANLQPTRETEPRDLLRRVTLDLTGLPPTPEEVDAFLKEYAVKPRAAYEALIDRLLASSAYGEKWGRRWLDIARYADSNGMDENLSHANAWRYRDYVIQAFNKDKPFDQFIREQIAGDLIAGGSDAERAERLTATGFLVIGPKMLAEDDPVKMRMDIIDEQLDTIGQAFQGLTLGCARCHDHKFDPISQADYYGLAGIFYSTKTMRSYSVVAQWHERPVSSGPSAMALAEHEKKVTTVRETLAKAEKPLREATLARLDLERKKARDYVEAAVDALNRKSSLKLVADDPVKSRPEGSVLFEAENFTRGNVQKVTDGYGAGIGVIINGGRLPNFAEYDVEVPKDGTYQIAIRYAAAASRPTKLSVNGKLLKPDAAGSVTGSWNPDTQKWFAEAAASLPKGKATIRIECPGPIPHFDKFALLPLTPEEARKMPATIEQIAVERGLLGSVLRKWVDLEPAWKGKIPTDAELARIAADANGPFRLTKEAEAEANQPGRAEVLKLREQLTKLEKARPPADEAMAVEEGKAEDLRIHLRGNHLTLGADAPRRFPTIISGDKQSSIASDRSGRLELANWIASKDNPLTARVIVNRIWLGHFGQGLVRSPDNFGRLGERPTHPELLDYLADKFIESGWSIKAIHRLILSSATYQQASSNPKSAIRNPKLVDPDNRLLWHFNRRRLDAEELRDGMLAVSGLLDRKMGGSLLTVANRAYVTSTANRNYDGYNTPRRSVYLPVVRSAVNEVLQTYDFPDPSTPSGLRSATTVPSQALLMLNSALVDQTAEAFAQSLLSIKTSDSARVVEGYRRAYGRSPSDLEVERALGYLEKAGADGNSSQAWRGLCRVLFASTEFVFVE